MIPLGCEGLDDRLSALESAANPPALTKREYFAALAMQGSMACDDPSQAELPETHAKYAVECADALLAALEAKP